MAELGTSPYINHFIQPDSIIPNPADPQSWNRFSYVQNNPIRYTDPTGHAFEDDTGGVGGPCNIIDCTGDDNDGSVFTEEQLNDMGIQCGENVAQTVCDLYLNPSDFNILMTADFRDPEMFGKNLTNVFGTNPINFLTSLSCILFGQGCVWEDVLYSANLQVVRMDEMSVIWNRRITNQYGWESQLFLASWAPGELNGNVIAREGFPISNGFLGFVTVYLQPSTENNSLVWRATQIQYANSFYTSNVMSIPLRGQIEFRTSEIVPGTFQTTGAIYLSEVLWGEIVLTGTQK